MALQASNFTQSDKKNDKDRQQMTENESVTKLHLGNSYVPYIGLGRPVPTIMRWEFDVDQPQNIQYADG